MPKPDCLHPDFHVNAQVHRSFADDGKTLQRMEMQVYAKCKTCKQRFHPLTLNDQCNVVLFDKDAE